MSEMSFEQMLEESFKTIRNGEVVEGTVIDVKPDEIFLNIGYKSDGIITRNEYTNEPNVDLTTVVKVGDKMEAKVVKLNDGEGQVILSYKRLQAEKGSKRLEEAFENQEVLKAKVTQVLAGGVCVSVDETRVFIPASLVSDTYEKDLNKFKDQEIEFIITEFDPRKRRIIGNRKVLLVEQKAKQQEELLANLHVGDVIEGTVKNVTDFGAFIDLGGVDGYAPVLTFSLESNDTATVLSIRDNGPGVRACDLPYVFEKGFTGDSGHEKNKATGMGLYLAREVAKDLGLTLTAASDWGAGFEIRVTFPVVEE